MGNREDLLEGAKQCLQEKGYSRTTVRDIAGAAGVSMAAIGYHFGSKDALINEAIYLAMDEWGERLAETLAAGRAKDPDATPLERFEETWNNVIASFESNRGLLAASFEVFAQVDKMPGMRDQLAAMINDARYGLAQLLFDIDPEQDEQKARDVGSFSYAILSGVLIQWMVHPESAPTGKELATALRSIMAGEAMSATSE